MTLTGMSSYGAGTILIGVARLVFVVSLFFLFTRLSGSAAARRPRASPSTPAAAISSSGAPSSPTSPWRCRCWS